MLRGQTSSELEAAFMQACQRADPRDTRAISRQVRQSPPLHQAQCRSSPLCHIALHIKVEVDSLT